MAFQSTIALQQGFGVVGDVFDNSPSRAESYIINSSDATNNVFGRAFTVSSQGIAQAGGTGVFAGILVNPKAAVLQGTLAGGSLAPSLTVPNYTQGELMTMGACVITLAAAANIGDLVVYNTTTGVLSTIAPGANLPVGTLFTGGHIDYYTVSGAGLAVMTLTPTFPIPVLA